MTIQPRTRWVLAKLSAIVCIAASALAPASLASASSGSAPSAPPVARASATRAIAHAADVRAVAARALAARRDALRSCLQARPERCDAAREAVRNARRRFAGAQVRLARYRHLYSSGRASHRGPGTSQPGAGSTPFGDLGSTDPGSSSQSSAAPSSGGPETAGGAGTGSGGAPTEGSTSGAESSPAGTESSTLGTASPFEMGVVAGSALSYERSFIHTLGARTARMEFEIDTPASQLAPIVEEYAREGIRPLLLASFYGRLPSAAEARNLASWAAEFGPGGTLWQGKDLPADTAVTDIEFGNETSYSYQFSENTAAAYAARAQTYAVRFAEAQNAIQAANAHVGLLAQGDLGNAPRASWMDDMFKAVPGFGKLVAGWTVHPYGPEWQSKMDEVLSAAKADGAPSIPLYVTEWGLSTDNGRCLDDNYGWNRCMSYEEAASTLEKTISAMRVRYGSQLAAFYVYEAHDLAASGAASTREKYFGALQSDGAPKGAYTTAVESLLSANP